MFKFNNKDTRMTTMASFWCLYCYFEYISHLALVFLLLFLNMQLPTELIIIAGLHVLLGISTHKRMSTENNAG